MQHHSAAPLPSAEDTDVNDTNGKPRCQGSATSFCVTLDEGLTLECGATVAPLDIAYCAYGTLSAKRDNAILVCHG